MSAEVLLRGIDITRRWGGLVAVDQVSIALTRGEVHAVIGTNGAGKSTLINILSGETPPSAGRVELLGLDVTAWSQPRRARAGLGRSYQRNTIYPGFTVFENCRLAAQARHQRPWAWWQSAQACEASRAAAHGSAQRAGLGDVLDRVAGTLSHGQKRQLEIAMCLATAPPRFYKSFDLQKQVFKHVLQCCAKAGNKIITVHSFRAAKAVLDHVESYLPSSQGKVVLHWFTGSNSEAKRAIELGCYFSINASMLDNERHVAMVGDIPLDRLLTETDGPFTKTAERPSKPADVAVVVEALGRLHRMSAVTLAETVRSNLRSLLELGEEGRVNA